MIKRSELQKIWRGTIRNMVLLNIFFAAIVAGNSIERFRTAAGPSIKEIAIAVLIWAGFNIALYFFGRLIKEAVDAWGARD